MVNALVGFKLRSVEPKPLFFPLSESLRDLWMPGFQMKENKVTHKILLRKVICHRPPQNQKSTLPIRLVGWPHFFAKEKGPVPGLVSS